MLALVESGQADAVALAARLNDLIARDLPVTDDWITDEELAANPGNENPAIAWKIEFTGLRPGEQVVIDGVFTLKSTLLRATLAEED